MNRGFRRRRKFNRDIQTNSRRRSGLSDAPKQLTSVYRNIGRLDEARDTELAALKLVPKDAETHYTVSVIDWTKAYNFSVAHCSLIACRVTASAMHT